MNLFKKIIAAFNRVKSYILIRLTRWVVNLYYRVKYLSFDAQKKRILIYTDSRGFLVGEKFANRTPYQSYIDLLSNDFRVNYQICKKKHTTTIDLLEYLGGRDLSLYDYLIIHTGVVDYSPRPMSQIQLVSKKKRKIWAALRNHDSMEPKLHQAKYLGEKTFSLYDEEFLKCQLLPEISNLCASTNVIWIGVNKVDSSWRGNYKTDRPENINVILDYQAIIQQEIREKGYNFKYLNVDEIEGFDLYKHTCDNIHFTKAGFELLSNSLREEIKN